MKRISSVLLIVLSLTLFSCSSNGPRDVAEKYTNAIIKGDFMKAKEYCTPEGGAMLDMMEAMVDKSEFAELVGTDYKFKFVSEVIDGDTAEVLFQDQDGKEDRLKLVKLDGKWKVILTL